CSAPATAQAAGAAPTCHGTTTAIAPGGERTFGLRCDDPDYRPQQLSVEIVDGPAHGTLEVLAGTRVRFVPAPGYSGDDSFTFRATDGESETPVRTQQLKVTTANLAPQCLPLALTAVQGSVDAPQPCYDPNEGDAVLMTVAAQPQHGSVHVNLFGGAVNYGASWGYAGPDAFSLSASDGTLTGEATELTVDVVPLEPPACESRPTLPVRTDSTKAVRLTCSDNRAQPIPFSFDVVDEPDHGQIDHQYGGFSYTPTAGFTGPDEITVRPQNGAGAGAPLTVDIVVADDANEAPECNAGWPVRLRTGASATVPTNCLDPDGDTLEHTFDPPPAHGAIASGSGPFGGGVYTADDGYAGPDSYGLRGEDPFGLSGHATQEIHVVGAGENTIPDCRPVTTRARNDRTATIPMQCLDADGDTVTFTWTDPEHGSVEKGTGFNPWGGGYLVYTPDAGYTGTDRLTFRGDDGHGGETVPIAALIEVTAPQPPSCRTPSRLMVRTGGEARAYFSCGADEQLVDPTLHVDAEHGTVTSEGWGYFTYRPDDGFAGLDSFTVRATNSFGHDDAVQEIEVGPDVNTVPQCSPHWNAATRQAPITLQLSCSDAEDDDVTLSVVDGPAHGDLGAWDQAAQRVTYTPDPGFVGEDTFTFRADDGRGHSATVEQRIRVRSLDANAVPRCRGFGMYTNPDTPASIWPWCSDGDGDPLTIEVVEHPAHGSVAPNEYGNLVYTPDAGYQGADAFKIAASDGRSTSPPAQIAVQVGSTPSDPPPPTCSPLAANVEHDTARRLRLRCTAFFGTAVPPEIVDAPQHGTLGAIDDDGWLTYTPNAGFHGTDRFTYRGVDGDQASAPATVELHVAAPPAARESDPPPPPYGDPPPPPGETPKGPPPPPGPDPFEQAAERRLGGDAVHAPGLDLGNAARAFVPAGAADGLVT
ncbi:MAG TPA: Ig-like domain-containing protein, partial [Solirubrobacteraceae bacterium]|nr:Ig-like domain-containing protein [Solirubrobacteraceae bacterium]